MRVPVGREKMAYNRLKHVSLKTAANRAGYSVHHFSNVIGPKVGLKSYHNGKLVFYDRDAFLRYMAEKSATTSTEPAAPIKRRKARRTISRGITTEPNNNGHMNIEVVMTPDVFARFITSMKKINPRITIK